MTNDYHGDLYFKEVLMKQPKKLTRDHKEYLAKKYKIDPTEWMLLTEDNDKYVYINKDKTKTITRFKK